MSRAPPSQAELRKADVDVTNGKLNRLEFLAFCQHSLRAVPLLHMERASTSYAEFRMCRRRRLNMRWRHIANNIDHYVRFWVPTTYFLLLTLLMSLDLSDGYSNDDAFSGSDGQRQVLPDPAAVGAASAGSGSDVIVEMQSGWGAIVSWRLEMVPAAIVALLVVTVAALLWLGMCAHEQQLRRREAHLKLRGMTGTVDECVHAFHARLDCPPYMREACARRDATSTCSLHAIRMQTTCNLHAVHAPA